MDQFFKPNRVYAVIGASNNPQKFGYKVFKWYKDHNIPAVPVNPKKEAILGTQSVLSLREVPVPSGYDLALSVITPPAVSKLTIESLHDAQGSVKSAWFQPGSHSKEVVDLARKSIPNVITDCILVNGDKYYSASRL